MSEALIGAGIAVLRADDRGAGGSTGDSSTARYVDLAADARRASKLDPLTALRHE